MPKKNQENNRWLILSYCSNIEGSACAQHLDDRLPYFRQKGIRVVLLTGVTGLRHSCLRHVRVASVAPSGIRFELRHLLRKRISQKWLFKLFETILLAPVLPFYLLEKILIDIESEWSWFLLAAVKGGKVAQQFHPTVIYSTGGSASAHIAAWWIARRTKKTWIAEFQDPLVHGDWGRSRRVLKIFLWVERLICRQASAVVFLTRAAMEHCKGRTALNGKGYVIYPGSRPKILPDIQFREHNFFTFTHLGSLSGSRNLDVFLQGLKLLFDEQPQWRSVVKLDLYGSMDKLCKESVENFPYPGVISDHGKTTREQALEAMMQSDCLLLIQNTQAFSEETIPSKVYEYFFSRRPILGLTYHNNELDEMLRNDGHFVAPADNAHEVAARINDILRQFREGRLFQAGGMVNEWTAKNAVDQLLAVGKKLERQQVGTTCGH